MVLGLLSDLSSTKSGFTFSDFSPSCRLTEPCDVLEETFN